MLLYLCVCSTHVANTCFGFFLSLPVKRAVGIIVLAIRRKINRLKTNRQASREQNLATGAPGFFFKFLKGLIFFVGVKIDLFSRSTFFRRNNK